MLRSAVRFLPITLAAGFAACTATAQIGEAPTIPSADSAATTPTGHTANPATPPEDKPANILIVLLDDVGIEAVSTYGIHPDAAPTPTLDRLAAEGLRFTHAYAAPVCGPARAQLLTGRYGRRTGMGNNTVFGQGHELPLAEVTLAELLQTADPRYHTAFFGKWHVDAIFDGLLQRPNLQGFDHADSSVTNISTVTDGSRGHYTHWERNLNGSLSIVEDYHTSFLIDQAIAHLTTAPEPWLAVVALHSAHYPLHIPPKALHSQTPTGLRDLFIAMVESADHEVGRLLDSLPSERIDPAFVVVMADNGTEKPLLPPDYTAPGGKGTLAEAALRVPFIVRSPLIHAPGRISDQLVHITDILPTIAAIADVDPATVSGPDGSGLILDGTSFLPILLDPDAAPVRTQVYAEQMGAVGAPPYRQFDRSTMLTATHRVHSEGTVRYHRLGDSPADESEDLYGTELSPPDEAAFAALKRALDAQLEGMPYSY